MAIRTKVWIAAVGLIGVLAGLLPGIVALDGVGRSAAVAAGGAATPASDEINGVVWLDSDADGINEANETGMTGAVVRLRDGGGTVVGTVTTTATGLYSFPGIVAVGPFQVEVSTPTLYTITDGTGGDNDTPRAGAADLGIATGVVPGTTVDSGVRPQWTISLGVWGGGPLTGAAPFNTEPGSACPGTWAPGDDCGNDDDVVRAQDTVNFLWSVSASNPEAALFAPLGDVVLEQTLVPAAGARVSVRPLPAVCLASGTGGTAPPTSRITTNPDGSVTIVCNLGPWTSTGSVELFNIDVDVLPSPNGSTFTSTARSYSTAAEVSGGNATTPTAFTPNAVEAPPVVETFTISANFRYDLNKVMYPGSGTAYFDHDNNAATPQLRGRLVYYQLGISSPRVGNEQIAQPITFIDDTFVAGPSSATSSTPYHDVEHYVYQCGPNAYGSSLMPYGGLYSPNRGVPNSGTCSATRSNPADPTSPYTFTLNGIDDSGRVFPTQYSAGNGDLSAGPYFIAAYHVLMFVPDRAMDELNGVLGDNIGSGWMWNRAADFEPVSTTGTRNYGGAEEPGLCDAAYNPYSTNPLTPGCATMPGTGAASNDVAGPTPISIVPPYHVATLYKWYYEAVDGAAWNVSPSTPLVPGSTSGHDGNGLQTPGATTLAYLQLGIGGELGAIDPVVCDVWDNSVQQLVPANSIYTGAVPPGTHAWVRSQSSYAASLGDTAAEWQVEYGHFDLTGVDPLAGPRSPLTGRFQGNWTVQRNAANSCRTTVPAGGWQTDPNAVPGGIDAVNVVRMVPTHPSGTVLFNTQNTSVVYLNLFIPLRARATFFGGPHDGEAIPSGTVIANFRAASYVREGATAVTNMSSTYAPEPETGNLDGDRLTMSAGVFTMAKNTVTIDGIGAGAAAVNVTGNAYAGDTIVWHLTPALNTLAGAPGSLVSGIRVVDVLPRYTTYDAACTSTITGGTPADVVEYNTPSAGQTRLTWYMAPQMPGEDMRDLYFCTQTDGLAPDPTSLVNTATVSSPEIPSPASDPHTVNLNQIGVLRIQKYVDSPLDELNDDQVWTVAAMNLSGLVSISDVTVIEVLPYNGDATNPAGVNRTPGSDYAGTLELTAVPTVVWGNDPARPAVPGTMHYTADPPATISQDLNINTSTWCTYAAGVFTLASGTGSCPASLADVTGLKWVTTPDLAPLSTNSGRQSRIDIAFTLQANGNTPANIYANRATAFSTDVRAGSGPGAPLQMLQSNRVEVATYQFTVGDLVFIDIDADGIFDPASDLRAPDGTIVELWNPGPDGALGGGDDTRLDTTTTTNGAYLFNELHAGRVYVRIPPSELAPGGHLDGWQFGPVAHAEDQNENTSHDVTAAPNGVTGVVSDVHTLSYTLVAGFPFGNEPAADNLRGLALPAGSYDAYTNLTIDLAASGRGSIGDFVWLDGDRDGSQDPGEPGITALTVELTWFGPDGVLGGGDDLSWTTTTDADGGYLFEHLPAGDFEVRIDGVRGLTPTFDADGTATPHVVTTTLGVAEADLDVDFGYTAGLSLGDVVFVDRDGNGSYNLGDDLVPDGVTVELRAADGTLISTTTTVGGVYAFDDLAPGDYYVQIPVSDFWFGAPLYAHQVVPGNPGGDPDNDIDNDSNAYALPLGHVRSQPITLSATFDPLTGTVTGDEPGGLANTTLDLGVFEIDPAVDIEKSVQTSYDADTPTGPLVALDDDVLFTYVVTNSGNVPLTTVAVTDDVIGTIVCPVTVLAVGAQTTCTVTRSAGNSGQYTNTGSVTAVGPATRGSLGEPLAGETVRDDDDANYFASAPAVDIEKFVQTLFDADTGDGPLVKGTARFTYVVTNSGNVPLSAVAVTDDVIGAIACPSSTLAVGAQMTCTVDDTVAAGAYTNLGTVEAVGPDTVDTAGDPVAGITVDDDDRAHYFGVDPAVTITKRVQTTFDADVAPGPLVAAGATVRWSYTVRNTGNVALASVVVTDDQLLDDTLINCGLGQDNVIPSLAVGQQVTCVAYGTATPGPYANTGRVDATGPATIGLDGSTVPGDALSDTDDAHYDGVDVVIDVETTVQTSYDADTSATAPLVVSGDTVLVEYVVTNPGNVPLGDIDLVDDDLGTPTYISGDADSDGLLDPGESWVYQLTTTASGAGDHGATATVTGTGPDTVDADGDTVAGTTVEDADDHHWMVPVIDVSIVKSTNGSDADAAPGPSITVGDVVEWTFDITNDGTVAVSVDAVDDSIEGPASYVSGDADGDGLLDLDETWRYSISGVAVEGQYANDGTVEVTGPTTVGPLGTDRPGTTALATDPSHYMGIEPNLTIRKTVYGDDANSAPGPWVDADGDVTFRYLVENTGNVTLTGVTVTDDVEGAISCPSTTLAAGATMTCTLTVAAEEGAYANLGTVRGNAPATTGPDGSSLPGAVVTDSDPAHYTGSNPGLHVEKSTNGVDGDTAPGAFIAAGDAVTWSYTVTNTGNVALAAVTVDDDIEGTAIYVDGDADGDTLLDVAETWTFEIIGIMSPGQYANLATATGTGPDVLTDAGVVDGDEVTDDDPSHAFGVDASIDVEKLVQTTFDADTADDGPMIGEGDPARFSYTITNTGNTALIDIDLVDDVEGAVSCPDTTLGIGESMTCTLEVEAVSGPYTNNGQVSGRPAVDGGTGTLVPILDTAGQPFARVEDEDPAHYTGVAVVVDIETTVQTLHDADDSAGAPLVAGGADVLITYVVTNPGNAPLSSVDVDDSVHGAPTYVSGDVDGDDLLDIDETWVFTQTVTASGTGDQAATGSVNATGPTTVGPTGSSVPGDEVTDADDHHVFVVDPVVAVRKLTNTVDASAAPGPHILVGGAVTWTYEVSNPGNVAISDLVVDDDIEGVATYVSGDSDVDSLLDPGETWVFEIPGTAAAGQYTNTSTVTGFGPDTVGTDGAPVAGPEVTDDDPSWYFGSDELLEIVKTVNGADADAAPGPYVTEGEVVRFEYEVTNHGNVAVTDVVVTDDVEGTITCPAATLAAGASMTCVLETTAILGAYANTGHVEGVTPDTVLTDGTVVPGTILTSDDPAHYTGISPAISVVKTVNGIGADEPAGTYVPVGAPTVFEYVVTNGGNVELSDVGVTDDREGVATYVDGDADGDDRLDVDETWRFRIEATATAGQYANVGTATGTAPATAGPDGDEVPGAEVDDTDPAHYFGADPRVDVRKFVQTIDGETDPVPVAVGDDVVWAYEVANTGNVWLVDVAVNDDVEGPISCPATALAPGTSMTCYFTAPATEGLYTNLGDVSGTPMAPSDPSDPDSPLAPIVHPATGDPMGPVVDDDPATYIGLRPEIDIETTVQTVHDADTPGDAPMVADGDDVLITYIVTNTGNSPLDDVVVSDPVHGNPNFVSGDDDGDGLLDPGETWIYRATVPASSDTAAATGSVTGRGPATVDADGDEVPGEIVTDIDAHHVEVVDPEVTVVKSVAGDDADSAPGPMLVAGSTTRFTYVVTNTGDVPVSGITLADDVEGAVSCPASSLDPGASMTCELTRPVVAGPYTNTATVTGTGPDTVAVSGAAASGDQVTDQDSAHYFGARPAVEVTKVACGTNGCGETVTVPVGGNVTWRITVRNTGNVRLDEVAVDDPYVAACTRNVGPLAPGESVSFDCVQTGVTSGYVNTVTATGRAEALGVGVTAGTVTDDNDAAVAVSSGTLAFSEPPAQTGGSLAFTGSNRLLSLIVVGLGLVLTGAVAWATTRRREARV